MKTATITAPNYMILSKKCELLYMGENVALPMGSCSAKSLEETLDCYPEIDIEVEFRIIRGSEREQQRYQSAMERRLSKLSPRYSFSGFERKIIDGYEQCWMTGRLQRCT